MRDPMPMVRAPKAKTFRVCLMAGDGCDLATAYTGCTDVKLSNGPGVSFLTKEGRQVLTTAMYIIEEETDEKPQETKV